MNQTETAVHRALGLTDSEHARIVEILGRAPNATELGMYAVMWSEHCSYKSSRIHLRSLPSEGSRVLVGPGEGAGIVEVDGVGVALRIESHNHPSFVEPFQGAATGIGGVVRDVLSVGARPIALLDPLRFGPLPSEGKVPEQVARRNRHLVEGVVSGISSYGNCIGVPTVGGEIRFEDCYSGNPLVNVMCVGVVPKGRITRARASGLGNKVLLLGSSTGRDGIGGVSVLASSAFDDRAAAKRPSVQVGDPFTEKLLIEATLELLDRGLATGVQDLGGAGLSCASSETAANGGSGMRIDLEAVPRREPEMSPVEVLTSESQERMLLIVEPGNLDEALGICGKWGLTAAVIGEVVGGGRLEVFENGEPVASVPAASLGDGPVYDRPAIRPDWLGRVWAEPVDEAPPDGVEKAFVSLIGSPNIACKQWAIEQYDHQVLLGTVVKPGRDAAVLRLGESKSRIAVATDGNGRFCYLDPRLGAVHSVAEAARNLSAVGAEPVALTNCLNFPSPERPEVMWQFVEVVAGMSEAAKALGMPIVGGNVSFYNETAGNSIYPTPVVGALGILPEGVEPPPLGFSAGGDLVVLIGSTESELGGSEYARTILGKVGGRPPLIDLTMERATQELVRDAIGRGLASSVHDLSEGGVAAALAEACSDGGMGAEIHPPGNPPLYMWLFSESPSRFLVSIPEENFEQLGRLAEGRSIPLTVLGRTGGRVLSIGEEVELDVHAIERIYGSSFADAMGY